MTNLGLPHPKLMAVAVPANLRCGRPEKEDTMSTTDADWAPLSYTFAGIWELQPDWLAENAGARADHRRARAGRIHRLARAYQGSEADSSGKSCRKDLRRSARTRPVVMVCRSGARSAQATVMLANAGYAKVANLAGGMLRWRAQRLPVEGGTD